MSEPPTQRLGFKYLLFAGDRYAFIGGLITVSIGVAARLVVGRIYSGYQARQLVVALVDSSLYFGAAVVTGSATVLALMLTLLSLVYQVDSRVDRAFFRQVQWISVLSAVAMAGAVLMLTLMSIPFDESENIPAGWYTIVYYVLSGLVVGLAGITITVVIMLATTVANLIRFFSPSAEEAGRVEEAAEGQSLESRGEPDPE